MLMWGVPAQLLLITRTPGQGPPACHRGKGPFTATHRLDDTRILDYNEVINIID